MSSSLLSAHFLEGGGVAGLLSLPAASSFPGHRGVVMVILRLVAEEDALLQVRMRPDSHPFSIDCLFIHTHLQFTPNTIHSQMAMEQELRQAYHRLQRRMPHGEPVPLDAFLPAVQPLVGRDPQVVLCVGIYVWGRARGRGVFCVLASVHVMLFCGSF